MTAPIISFVGYSNTGKTTVITGLIKILTRRGLKVSAVKHAMHGFHMDRPGKDTHNYKQAGAQGVLIVSNKNLALVREHQTEPTVFEMASQYLFDSDLILVEGYKKEALPKIEMLGFNPECSPQFANDPNLKAVVGTARPAGLKVPFFEINQLEEIADFLMEVFLGGLKRNS